jgi:leukotriene-A4 hydrolase
MGSTKRDFQTLSNYNEIRTTQVSLNFDLDFEKKILKGTVVLKLNALVDDCKAIILDTRYADPRPCSHEDVKLI